MVAYISPQKAVHLLRNNSVGFQYTTLAAAKKFIYTDSCGRLFQFPQNLIMLSSGAKLYHNLDINPKGGWFIGGYASDGKDVKCYLDPALYKQRKKEGYI